MRTLVKIGEKAKMAAFRAQLAWKGRRGAVAAAIARAEQKAGGPPRTGLASRDAGRRDPNRVRVAAVQMRLRLVTSGAQFAEEIYGLARRAAEQGAELVVFPEYSGVPFLGLLPGLARLPEDTTIDQAIAALTGDNAGGNGSGGNSRDDASNNATDSGGVDNDGVPISAYFRAIAPGAQPAYEAAFSEVARRLGIYVVTGSIVVPDHECTVNKAYFFGPDGQLLGTQHKTHLVPEEERWRLTPGGELNLFETPWGKIAMPVCMDATYFETFRIAALRGADIVIIPSANQEKYVYGRANRGIWPRVQETHIYGIGSSAVGRFMGLTFSGRSAVIAPLEMTPGRDGFIARAASPEEPEIVVGDLDLEALRRFRAETPLFVNRELYRRYLPALYEEARRRRERPYQ